MQKLPRGIKSFQKTPQNNQVHFYEQLFDCKKQRGKNTEGILGDETITTISDLNFRNTSPSQASTGSLFLSHSSLSFFSYTSFTALFLSHSPLAVYAFPFSWNTETANARVSHFFETRNHKYVFKIIAPSLRQMSRCAMI